ncbi:GntR family transcriptional regulator [Actinosynnema sp. NPDC002837]
MPANSNAGAADQAVSRVVDGIKRMIVSGDLLPGQQIRQERMAAVLGVSRLPVREGLRQLVADGLVAHEHNVGFAVARLSRPEFDQVYLMRRLLETEVIRSLPRPDAGQLDRIGSLAEDVERAAAELDLPRMREANSAFHQAIFGLSGLNLVVAEINRIWTRALPYHAVYLYDEGARTRILAEHRDMLAALGSGDLERLVELMDTHREGSEAQLSLMFRAGAAPRPSAG